MGMGMGGVVFGLVHAVVLLAISFFVLLLALKSDSKPLKAFGLVIAALLWICAALVFGKGAAGRPCMMGKMDMMANKQRGPMAPGMMERKADNPPMPK